MLSIGEFASIGRVSVRMLRHYDAIGLLTPARVDGTTGYRSYEPEQLTTLSRIVQLRDLGIGLDGIREILDGDGRGVDILRDARDALRRGIESDRARLARLEAALRRDRGEHIMPTPDTIAVDVHPYPRQHAVVLRDRAPGMGNANIGPVVSAIYPRLAGMLVSDGVPGFGPAVAQYEADETGDGSGMTVVAGFVVPDAVVGIPDAETLELPAVARAAVTVHRGSVEGIGDTWMALHAWIAENGMRPDGVGREVYWTPGDRPQEEWVTDIVQPVAEV